MEKTGIKIEGYKGTWYVLTKMILPRGEAFLLEHEIYGDEVGCLIVNEKLEIIVDDVWNGFEDLEN